MKWSTRSGVHVDRAACAWLIRRFLDQSAEFSFVEDPDEITEGSTPFDIRGVELSHHHGRCSFEVFLQTYDLHDPVLWELAKIIHEADLFDETFDVPEARGLDAICRGLSLVAEDHHVLEITALIFDGLYEFRRRSLISGKDPS